MKMKMIFLFTSLLISFQARSSELNHSAGFGLQYAGLVGYQISSTTGKHNFRGAIGIIGAGIGYDYLVTDHFSIGASQTFTIRTVTSINLNYYPAGSILNGWQIGLDFGHMPDSGGGDGFFNTNVEKNVTWISFG